MALVRNAISLDYGNAASADLLNNLSGCALAGDRLWTVSDEGRTIERLQRDAGGFSLGEQFQADAWVAGIPGQDDGDELDLESIDVDGNTLWLCGSHCRVRKNTASEAEAPNAKIRDRMSRRILARFQLTEDGTRPASSVHLPFEGPGSLRSRLDEDPYLKPFRELPSKENGLDIEGMAVLNGRVFLGLRGPLVDSIAIVVELALGDAGEILSSRLHFLKLGGLGIRELARDGNDILVLSGPVSDAAGPFYWHRWTPGNGVDGLVTPPVFFTFDAQAEKPEGACLLSLEGRRGLLLLYDRPDASRLNGSRYQADWLPLDE